MPIIKHNTNMHLKYLYYGTSIILRHLRLVLVWLGFWAYLSPSFMSASEPTIVIHWSGANTNDSPDLLLDRNGVPLSSGGSGNGNGFLITLGYFDQARDDSLANHFLGKWIPLTQGTSMGDSSSGYGFEDGMFYFTTNFRKYSSEVIVYPYRPASYTVEAPFSITSNAPSPGTPICIRFYDSDTVGPAARYNTVTGHNWVWPEFFGGIPVNYYFKIAAGTAPSSSDWLYGCYFEDPDNNFTTSIELQSYLTVNIEGSGSVESLEPSYNYGSQVPITAVPAQHMDFVEWQGSGITDSSLQQTTVDMTADRNITAVFAPHHYNVTINKTGNGTVTSSGTHAYGSTIALSADPAAGYNFSHWSGYGPDSNVSATTSLTIQQDHALVAVFTPLAYTIETSVTAGGSVNISEESPYLFDSNYTLIASPDFGYIFSHWSSPSDSLSFLGNQNSEISTFLVQGDASYQANFSLITYNLSVAMGTGGMEVSPASGDLSILSNIAVSATPLEGYDFAGWEDPQGILVNPNLANTEANMSIAMGDASVTATFSKKTYPVTVNEGDGGNISLNPTNGPWEHFGVYELNATAQNGYSFSEWQGDIGSTNSLLLGTGAATNKIGVSGPITLNAVFVANSYTVATSKVGGGTVTGLNTYSIHNSPSIEAAPDEGWYFNRWEGDLQYLVAPDSSSSLINLTAAPLSLSYTAIFSREIYDTTVNIEGSGSVNENDESFTLSTDSATAISLNASPSNGWYFDRWYGQELTDSSLASTMFQPTQNGSIAASFLRKSYSLNVSSSNGGDANGTGIYPYESNLKIQATASPGFMFTGWSGNTDGIDIFSSSIDLQIFDQNLTLHASFSPIPLTVTTSVSGTGSILGAGTYDMGEIAILEAQPGGIDASAPRGYQLEKWIWHDGKGNYSNSSNTPLHLFMDSNFTVTAFYSSIPPDVVSIELVSSPPEAGILFDDPSKRSWNTATDLISRELLATANPAYSFIGWSSEENISFDPSWKSTSAVINPVGNATVTANFSPKTYKLEISYDSAKGSVTGGGFDLAGGIPYPVSALPAENIMFQSWEIVKEIDYNVTRDSSSITPSETVLFIDAKERPALSLIRGFTYNFTCDLPGDEKIYFATSRSASLSESYTTGISDRQSTDGTLSFTVPHDAPDSLYYCSTSETFSSNKISILSIDDDEIVPFPSELSIEPLLDHDLALKAHFVSDNIAINVMDAEGGTVTGISDLQTFAYEELVEITAIPNQHYEFIRWEFSDSIVVDKINPTLSFQVFDTISIRPIFEPKTYTLTLLSSPTDSGNAFTTDNKYHFSHGTNVAIQAIPHPGSSFEGWSGNVAEPGKSFTSVLIENDTTIIAQYSDTLINITKELVVLDADGTPITAHAGTITGGSEFALGATGRFSAYPSEGFQFLRWEDDNGNILSTAQTSNIQISGFSKLSAIVQKKMYEIQIVSNPRGKGEVKWHGLGSGESLEGLTVHGDTISLQATPVDGYVFEKWTSSSGDLFVDEEVNLDLQILSSQIVNARFTPINPVELVINKYPTDSGWTFGQGTVNQNPKYSIFAKPNPGYLFDRWEGSEILSTNDANTQINLNQNKEITAYFKVDPDFDPSEWPTIDEIGLHNLKVSTADYSKGSVSGAGIFGTGWAEIKASAQEGYAFVRWEGEAVEDETSNNTFLFLTEDSEVEAIFSSIPKATIEGSVQVSNNWWESDWFGIYLNINDNWSFHTKLGWIHIQPQGNSSDSLWLWIDTLESWCWTGSNTFPYLYNQRELTWDWVDLNRSTSANLIYFRFANDHTNGTWYSR